VAPGLQRSKNVCVKEEDKATKCSDRRLGDFNFGGQVIQNVKYADDLVLKAKEETVVQGMIGILTETGRYYGMEMNVEKSKVMRIPRQPSPVTITIDQNNWKKRNVLNMWVAC